MLLSQLFTLAKLPFTGPDSYITGLALNSAHVKPGHLFAALPGTTRDGATFIPQAIKAGARVILAAEGTLLPTQTDNVILLTHSEPRSALARLAAAFYMNKPDVIAGITGTNGKTSTVSFLRQIWANQGLKAASLGTLGLQGLSNTPDFGPVLTTPDSITLAHIVAFLQEQHITHLAMEASSHGLEQHRLDGLTFQGLGFTNLTRDHLDYHGTIEHYLNAKLRLFDLLDEQTPAILNADIDPPLFETIISYAQKRKIKTHTIGKQGQFLKLIKTTPLPDGQEITVEDHNNTHQVFHTPLIGYFQVENIMMAAALAALLPHPTAFSFDSLSNLTGVNGRLQHIATLPQNASVYIDYAHTPDALMRVLEALRPHTQGKLIVVFGAGGDRDRGKRPLMGQIAQNYADKIIVTDDNPRSEKPEAIRKDILTACPTALEIGDRKTAIATGMDMLSAGDILLIAGKGHEEGQTIAGTTYPFNDAQVIRALAAHS